MEFKQGEPERFVSMICLRCLNDSEHVKEHPEYNAPWIPTLEEIEEVDKRLRNE